MEINPIYVTDQQKCLLQDKGIGEVKGISIGIQQWEVIEWLRIKHNIWVYVTIFQTNTQYYCEAWIKHSNKDDICVTSDKITHTPSAFNSPQEAYSAAFDYILNNLI